MKIHRGVVLRTTPLSPTLTRVTLGGPGIREFVSTGIGDEYVRVFFPHGDDPTQVSLPVPTEDWWETPEGAPEAPMRTYTISGVRPDAGEVDIDFVLHAAGVAGPWAARAEPGHVLGLNSPTGLYRPPAGIAWQVLVSDLTGLPAVARIAADAPVGVRTRIVLEVPDDADRVPLAVGPDVEITWVIGGNGRRPSALGQLVRATVDDRLDLDRGYVWVAGETIALRDARTYLRRELGLAASRFKVVGYWTPIAAWDEKFAALPDSVRRELDAIWAHQDDAEVEDVQLRYEEKLDQLGL
ncbi:MULTISPECIES: siderophore-interacting protein [Microbacterium]|uniref:siderophore-interacting protein n=1 Tax=Microbacterium TaxID=33882 RepID=UPI002786C7F3|nr:MULTISPECIES: siderophore-interacting protein [Microbacterium]MDQ1082772.1 NADPH-dependent ferric siderophore reductase [Microbacterium sp. SORGH_AS_0344]MDQ1168459.1 NADPH-dependent ferric siderophore reductase [Microbacterium proteolyticum]